MRGSVAECELCMRMCFTERALFFVFCRGNGTPVRMLFVVGGKLEIASIAGIGEL